MFYVLRIEIMVEDICFSEWLFEADAILVKVFRCLFHIYFIIMSFFNLSENILSSILAKEKFSGLLLQWFFRKGMSHGLWSRGPRGASLLGADFQGPDRPTTKVGWYPQRCHLFQKQKHFYTLCRCLLQQRTSEKTKVLFSFCLLSAKAVITRLFLVQTMLEELNSSRGKVRQKNAVMRWF